MSSISYKLPEKHYFSLDIIIAIILICVATAFIVWSISSGHYGIQLPVILLVPSSFYLRFRDRIFQDVSLPQLPESNRIRLITHTIFIISLTLISWLSWSNLYYRPPLYFVLILVAAASIIIDIFYLNETKTSHITIALFKIIALSFIIYATIYYQFPGIYGSDPWWHNEWIKETINLGHVTTGEFYDNSYYLFPIFHLVGALAEIITGMPIYSSVFASIGVLMATSSIFVFLLGKKLINAKAGLLVALIIPLTVDNIVRAAWLIPMSLGYFLFLVILYLVFCRERKRALDSLLIVFLSIALILTHTIAALVTLLCFIVIFIGFEFYIKIDRNIISRVAVSLTLIMFFGVAMLARWMQNPPNHSSFFTLNIKHLVSSLQIDSQFVLASPSVTTNISYGVILLNQGGYSLLLAFGIIGALIYLHPEKRTQNNIALVLVAGLLFALPLEFSLFKLKNILSDRWVIFLYVPLSVLAISGLLSTLNLINTKTKKLAMVMLYLLVVIFTMTTNPVANADSPLVYNGAVRAGYTQSELSAIATLSDMKSGRPVTDIYYAKIFPYVISYNKYMDMVQGNNTIFIQRKYYLHNPEWDGNYRTEIDEGGIDKPEAVLILDYIEEHGITKGSLIYNNGNVKTYIIPSGR